MSHKIARKLIETKLAAFAAGRVPPVRIAWQNAEFAPAGQNELYLQAFLLPASTISADLLGAHRAFIGVFQISINAPVGIGSKAAQELSEAIAAEFPVNLVLTEGATRLQIITPASEAAAIQDGARFIVPVSFQYRIDSV